MKTQQTDIHITPRFLRALISFVFGTIVAHIPLIISLFLLSIPTLSSSNMIGAGILILAVIISVIVGIGSFRWVYRRLGSVGLGGINDKVT